MSKGLLWALFGYKLFGYNIRFGRRKLRSIRNFTVFSWFLRIKSMKNMQKCFNFQYKICKKIKCKNICYKMMNYLSQSKTFYSKTVKNLVKRKFLIEKIMFSNQNLYPNKAQSKPLLIQKTELKNLF